MSKSQFRAQWNTLCLSTTGPERAGLFSSAHARQTSRCGVLSTGWSVLPADSVGREDPSRTTTPSVCPGLYAPSCSSLAEAPSQPPLDAPLLCPPVFSALAQTQLLPPHRPRGKALGTVRAPHTRWPPQPHCQLKCPLHSGPHLQSPANASIRTNTGVANETSNPGSPCRRAWSCPIHPLGCQLSPPKHTHLQNQNVCPVKVSSLPVFTFLLEWKLWQMRCAQHGLELWINRSMKKL